MGIKLDAGSTAPHATLLALQEAPAGSQGANSASPSKLEGAVPAAQKHCGAATLARRDLSAVSFEDRAEL